MKKCKNCDGLGVIFIDGSTIWECCYYGFPVKLKYKCPICEGRWWKGWGLIIPVLSMFLFAFILGKLLLVL